MRNLIVLWRINLETQIYLSALGWSILVKFYFVPLRQSEVTGKL